MKPIRNQSWQSSLCGTLLVVLTGCGGGDVDRNAPAVSQPRGQSGQSVAYPDVGRTSAVLAWAAELNRAELQRASQTVPEGFDAGQAMVKALAAGKVTAYRFYNQQTGAHFYTTSVAERDIVQGTLPQFQYEGPAFFASSVAAPGLSAVHRFFNRQTGVHFYTISEDERAAVEANLPQFQYEGVAYYASRTGGTNLVALYRFFLSARGFHFYSSNVNERDNIIATLPQYSYEGIGYHVLGVDWELNPSILIGTAAIGSPLRNGLVTVRDRTGASVCTNAPVTTGPTGDYRCVLSAGSQAPYAVLVTDPDGLISPLIGIVPSRPQAGAEGVANITPLTTAMAAQLDPSRDPFRLYTQAALLGTLDLANLQALNNNVVTQLADVLNSIDLDPATFNPLTTPFVGGSGTGADGLLDQIRITYDNGAPRIANAFNPDEPSVAMAGPLTVNPPLVSISLAPPAFQMSELNFAQTELERCFAVEAGLRVPELDAINQRLLTVSPECQNFAARAGQAPNVDIDFLNSGYGFNSYFYRLLSDPAMSGARFNAPELMRYQTMPDGRDEALLNIKFRDRDGYASNRILVAKKFPGSRPSGSQWWLIGNQRSVDAYIRAAIRQREQTVPDAYLDLFSGAALSRYEVGLEIYVHRPNNGSGVNNPNNPNNDIRYVRVSGPGLPIGGLMFADVAPTLPQTWMGILNATGANPNQVTPVKQVATNSGNIFLIQRTQGTVGAAASTLRPNPGVQSANAPFVSWAHPSMYSEAPSASWQFDLSRVPAWSLYTFEVYCGTDVTICDTFDTRITTPLLPATYASVIPWHTFAQSSRTFVTNGAAAVNSAVIAWTSNALAERVTSVNAYSFGPDGEINSPSTLVPPGVFSLTVPAAFGSFPAISVNDTVSRRILQLRYGMLDGSFKDQLIQFN